MNDQMTTVAGKNVALQNASTPGQLTARYGCHCSLLRSMLSLIDLDRISGTLSQGYADVQHALSVAASSGNLSVCTGTGVVSTALLTAAKQSMEPCPQISIN